MLPCWCHDAVKRSLAEHGKTPRSDDSMATVKLNEEGLLAAEAALFTLPPEGTNRSLVEHLIITYLEADSTREPQAVTDRSDQGPTLQPLGRQVLVQLDPPAELTRSGLVIPQPASTTARATVLQIGQECRDVQIGGQVIVSKLQGIALPGDRLLLPEAAILAYLTD
jgi:co-chaperonin GroES (HSP10)